MLNEESNPHFEENMNSTINANLIEGEQQVNLLRNKIFRLN